MAAANVVSGSLVLPIHSAVRGRARLRVASLYHSPGLKKALESQLSGKNGIRSVSANILTGNILVLFDPDRDLRHIVGMVEFAVSCAGTPSTTQTTPSAELDPPEIAADQHAKGSAWLHLKDLLWSTARAGIAGIPLGGAPQAKHFGRAFVPSFWSHLMGLYRSATGVRSSLVGAGELPHLRKGIKETFALPEKPDQPWHTICAEDVARLLDTSCPGGLATALAAQRLLKYGPNVLPPFQTRTGLSIFIDQFKSLPVLLLVGAAIISVSTGGLADAVMIIVVILLNASIGFVTELQAEKTISSLLQLAEPQAVVIRDGTSQRIGGENVTLGDLLVLTRGCHVVADARLLEAHELAVDESVLTGESMPVEKSVELLRDEDLALADRINMVFRGTVITAGSGLAIVVGMGINTELGLVQGLIAESLRPETPLEGQLKSLGNRLVWFTLAVAGGTWLIGLLRGLPTLEMLKSGIALAVAAVPEGLPTVATTALASGVSSLLKKKVLVRHLDALETLGTVQVLCFDKTGTLTVNEMAVMSVFSGTQRYVTRGGEFIAEGRPIELSTCPELIRLLQICVLCNEVEVDSDNGVHVFLGSPTESALMRMAVDAGVDVSFLRRQYPLLITEHRTQTRNYMTTTHRETKGLKLLAMKGSPTEVLALSTSYERNGRLCSLTEKERKVIEAENERMASAALRVLGLAYREEDEEGSTTDPGLIWVGLVGIANPIREGLREEVTEFRRAGIRAVMLTGDQTTTASAVGRELDLSNGNNLTILDSAHLVAMQPEEFSALVPQVDVFSRVNPSHKLQIVRAYQQAGKVVAMTGDGINDGPALKAADIGIALGEGGTQVAREVADILLIDDNLQAMIPAVREGRRVYEGIRKAIHYTAATNTSEILVMFAALATGLGQPFNPRQLLMINILSDVFPELALALAPPEGDLMRRRPRDAKESIIAPSEYKRLGFQAAVMGTAGLATYGYGVLRYGIGPQASTMAFSSLMAAQLLHGLSARSERHGIFDSESMPPNPYLSEAIGAGLGVLVLSLLVPGLRRVLGTAPIGVSDAIVCSAAAGLSLLTIEAMKGVWREDDTRALLPAPDRQDASPILPLKSDTVPA
jgi:P-type Ca2+ transporter type 2C